MAKKPRIVLLTCGLALVLVLAWLFGQHSSAGNSLRSYKAALRAQGEKLTFAELTASFAGHSNLSQMLLTNAVASIGFQKLLPGGLELRKYVAPGQVTVIWQQNPPFWGSGVGSGPGGTWEEFAAELDRIQQPMQQIREALKNPDADAGPLTNVWARRVDFVRIRVAAQWLMGAALSDVRRGDYENSLQDLEALASLAQLHRNEFTLVSQMIRTAVTGLGISTTWEVLQAPGWTEPQLLRLQRAWEQVDLLSGLEHGLLGERAFGEEFWLQAHQSTNNAFWSNLGFGSQPNRSFEEMLRNYFLFPLYKVTSMDQDLLFRLRAMQDSVLMVRSLQHGRPWPEARQVADQLTARITTLAKSPQRFRYWFSLLSIANCSRAAQTVARNETERRLALTAIALRRFYLRHQHFPGQLQELVPSYLSSLPLDPMSGKTLCYHLKPDGQFVLYSVGEDGKDDGGDPQPATSVPRPGLWEGRDALWPCAAAPKQ